MKKLLEIFLIVAISFGLCMFVNQKDSTSTTNTTVNIAQKEKPVVEAEPKPVIVADKEPVVKAESAIVKSKNLAIVYTFDKDMEAQYNELIEKKIKTIGYYLSDPHKRVNDYYKEKYGSTNLDILSFMSIVNKDKVKSLLNIDPRIAGFSPFNLLIYKKKSEDETHIIHLLPEAILDIIGINDKKLRAEYIASFEPLDAMIEKELGGTKSYIEIDNYAPKGMMNFELSFERTADLDDFIDDFQEKFEELLEAKEYLVAGYLNLKAGKEDLIPNYDAFWSYSLCHFKFSFNMFDNEGGRPKAGVFAPCSMYMYIKKDSSTLVIGMPTLANWAAALSINDTKRAELIKKLDSEIPAILESLGAKVVPNVNPLTRESATTNTATKTTADKTEAVTEKKPETATVAREVKTPSTAGHIEKEFISAYLRGSLTTVPQIEADLKKGGFEVLGNTNIDKADDLTTISFTSVSLKKMASKEGRGFMGVLKVLVDKVNSQISISNPLYFAKAYLQDDFDKTTATAVLDQINKTFEGLKNSKDGMEFDDLSEFHFTVGMPYYKDMESVASGENAKLLEKVKASGNLVFELTLDSGATLVGVKLDKRTTKFVKKIGANNAGVIPYTILIEDGEAKVLAPKYSLAIHYPLLDMAGFMTIATVPGAILADCEKIFK